MTRKVFLASDVILAFLDRNHPKHFHAAAFFRYFGQEHFYLYTSSEIIISVYQKVSQNISPSFAKEFLKDFSESSVRILVPEESEVKKAIQTVVTSFTQIGIDEVLMLIMAQNHYIPSIATFSYLHNLFGRETFYLPI